MIIMAFKGSERIVCLHARRAVERFFVSTPWFFSISCGDWLTSVVVLKSLSPNALMLLLKLHSTITVK